MGLEIVPKVTILPVETRLPVPVERILEAALESKMQRCIIIGEDENGELYFASSDADGGTVLWWMEKAKKALLDI